MNWVDITVLLLIGWNVFATLSTGLIRELFAVAGFIAGVYVAGRFAAIGANLLFFLPSTEIATVVSFAVIFLVISYLVRLLAGFVQQGAQLLMLGWFDQIGGALVGLLKGVLLTEVILIIFANFQVLNLAVGIRESRIASFLLGFMPSLLIFLPKELKAIQVLFPK